MVFVTRPSVWTSLKYWVSVGFCALSHWQREEGSGCFGCKVCFGGGDENQGRENVRVVLGRNRLFFLLRAAEGKNPADHYAGLLAPGITDHLVSNSFKMVSFINILIYLMWTLHTQQMYSVSISWWKQA